VGSEEGKVMGNGSLECAAWEISRIFGINFDFRAALLRNFGNGIARKRETLLMRVNIYFFTGVG
jgi:hypothetical protein